MIKKRLVFQFKGLNSYSNDQILIQIDQSGTAASLPPAAADGSMDGTAQPDSNADGSVCPEQTIALPFGPAVTYTRAGGCRPPLKQALFRRVLHHVDS
jgi:hypothetical protein